MQLALCKPRRRYPEYNENMTTPIRQRIPVPSFLDVATYVSMAAMSLLGISGLSSLPSQLMALGLVFCFGLLYHFVFRSGGYQRTPDLYFGAQILILCLLFLLRSDNEDAFNFLFLILAIHIAVVSPARKAILWIAVGFGMLSLLILATVGLGGLYAILFYSVTFVVCGFFGSTIQQVERERERNERLVEELQATQRKLQDLAVMEERNRLARDLHDSVKQQVFAVSMQLGAARSLLEDGNKAYGPVTEAERLAKQAGAELTTLIRELRPPNLESKALPEALQEYVTTWSRQNGIVAEVKADGVSAIPLLSDETLFRVAQEALANVARHSKAGHVTVELAYRGDDIMLIVEDNGLGFDLGQVDKGIGLDSMRERLEAIGGRLDISSQMSGGTKVMATLRRS
jgi:signal transduction histidine kinase